MSDLKFDINTSESTVTVLEGKAPAPVELNSYSINGDLNAPMNFHKAHDLSEELESHVLFDYNTSVITLIMGANHPHTRKIAGSVLYDPDFMSLKINTGNVYGRQDLMQTLKFMRRHFPDPKDCLEVVAKLKQLEASFITTIEQRDDERGNKANLLEQTIQEVNFPETITLRMPVIRGEQPRTFTVDILFDISQGKYLTIWLESVDVKDIVHEETVNRFETIKKYFEGQDRIAVIVR